MTELIGLAILIGTAYLSVRYRPEGKDSFTLLSLCLFCGLIALLSGVERVGLMNVGAAVSGIVMVALYRGQLRARPAVKENPAEAMKVMRIEERAGERISSITARHRDHYVA